MKSRIEPFTSLNDWTIVTPNTIALNGLPPYIAGLGNETSLLAKFQAGSANRVLAKTLPAPVDISSFQFLVFSMWSRDKGKSGYLRNDEAEFSYKIKINATAEYFIPVREAFTDININIEDVDTIDRIEITALHADEDVIILSEMVADLEEMPIDLMEEMKAHLEFYVERQVGKGLLLGTISATAGDTTISTSDYDFIERYSVLLIDDGTNSERHQVQTFDDNTQQATLGDIEDGGSILHTYSGANLYLTFPVTINPDESTIRLPGFSVWAFAPQSILRTGKRDTLIEAFKVGGEIVQRPEGHVWRYITQIDCESRSGELNAIMSKVCRDFGGHNLVWINGRKHDMEFDADPVETRPPSAIDIIPRIQYRLWAEVIEIMDPSEVVAKAAPASLTVRGRQVG